MSTPTPLDTRIVPRDPDEGGSVAEVAELGRRLTRSGIGDIVSTDRLDRALYTSDASLYRVVPGGVARPRTVEELAAVLATARELGIPVTARGAGTSCAGNAVGTGLIVDVARHLTAIHAVDPAARTATVEPGVVQATLQRAAARHRLRFGPDPSTSSRCTIGGMIGNNACGPRAMGYGRTADNLVALEMITGTGERISVGPDTKPTDSPTLTALSELVGQNLPTIRTEFGRFGRQVSGYSLEHLLPEQHFAVARFLAGTEGTLGVITRATVQLVSLPTHTVMVALGYPTMADAADDVLAITEFSPVACEGLDRRIVDVVARRRGPSAVPDLPRGDGWMFVELAGEDAGEVLGRAQALAAASGALESRVITDPGETATLWRIREDGAGLASVSLPTPAYAGWEDSAVPPAELGAYLRALDALFAEHALQGLPYGHFGDGCVHVRIDFPLTSEGGAQRYRDFVTAAARLVASHGGSMSGEHGDGRARSELLEQMYSPAAIGLFGQVKAIFDPDDHLNPGVLVRPRPVDADLRAPQIRQSPLLRRDPLFAADVHRCSGVGKCLANTTQAGGVMCPSFQATHSEKDSTRGRARVLQEMINGELVGGYRAPEVHEALDLCLSCKGCRRDCPTGIDMAAYKAKVLDESYRHRLRPRSHYVLGWLPRWARLITAVPGLPALVNGGMHLPLLRRIAKWVAGVDQRRSLPRFAAHRAGRRPLPRGEGTPVLLWVDSFSDCFPGSSVEAMVRVLQRAGYAPQLPERTPCCGLTWISTGQLDAARARIRDSIDILYPYVQQGIPIVGMEPSCLAVWRSDAPELVADSRVEEVGAAIRTLAELLTTTDGWRPPDLSDVEIVAQPHCHHASVIGWSADARILADAGASVTTVGGCCGLAGNFGVEQGHYDVSVAVAQHDLLPAVETAGPDAVVLADGFSCRTQLTELAHRKAITLAELLDGAAATSSASSA